MNPTLDTTETRTRQIVSLGAVLLSSGIYRSSLLLQSSSLLELRRRGRPHRKGVAKNKWLLSLLQWRLSLRQCRGWVGCRVGVEAFWLCEEELSLVMGYESVSLLASDHALYEPHFAAIKRLASGSICLT